MSPSGADLYSFNFDKNFSKFFFGESCLMSVVTEIGKLRIIEIGHRGVLRIQGKFIDNSTTFYFDETKNA